jgi:CBS domain containing-hemolysin-like protein
VRETHRALLAGDPLRSSTVESPKTVGRFYLAQVAFAIVVAVVVSIGVGDISPLLWTLAVIAVLLVLCVIVSLFFAVVFGPLLWLLSRLSGKGRSQEPSGEERK